MLPVPTAGLGALQLPTLPPTPSGPEIGSPGQFKQLYDHMQTQSGEPIAPQLPTAMEVRPLMEPATSLSQAWKPSPNEFPGAVDPDALRVPGTSSAAPVGQSPYSFLEPLKDGLAQVGKLQNNAEKMANEAALGGDVDLHDVMIASEKAGVSLQLTLQVRNKLVEAYQEVMRMQI